MSENNDFIQLPPIKKDTPSEVVSMIWQYLKLPEESRKRVKAELINVHENCGKEDFQIPNLYDMDEKPEDYSQEDDAGLDLIDFYVLPHYLTAPFKKVTEKIMTEFSDLNLCPINNRQGIVIDGEGSKVICKD